MIAPGNMAFYKGAQFPQWNGSLLITGMGSQSITRVTFDAKGNASLAERWAMGKRVRDIKVSNGRATGVTLDDALRDRIKRAIREQTSPHHVPRIVAQVTDIPRTISGKISEIAVRETIHGRPVDNSDALANPESLALFRAHPALVPA